MSCDEVNERLPWLVGGGLDPAEAQAVRAHLSGCPACQEALRETRQAAAVFGAHLPAAVLVDLAWDRQPALPDEVVRTHLEGCEACAGELDLARQSRALEQAAGPAPAARTKSAGWAGRLAGWGGAAAAGLVLGLGLSTVRAPQPLPAPSADPRLQAELQALRAGNAELQQQVEAARAPQLNVPVLELFPDGATRGGAAGEGEADLPAGAQSVTVLLSAESPDRAATVELRDGQGRVLWSGTGLRPGPHGAYSLSLPRALLEGGPVTLHVQPHGGRPIRYTPRVRPR